MAGQVGKVSVENVIFDKTGHLAIGLPCPFMAPLRHANELSECPLTGEDQK